MGQPRRQLSPERSALDLWGTELRAWRDRRGLSLAKLGQRIRYDPSYLARLERAERFPPEQVAQACDRELDAGGELSRLWHLADADRRRTDDHVARTGPDVARTGPEVESDPLIAAASESGEIVIPCRDTDGRIIWVSVPRRVFLRGGLGLAAGAAAGLRPPPVREPHPLRLPGAEVAGDYPAEHLRRLRAVLVDSDNLLGPRSALQAVSDHLGVIQQLRQHASGADRQVLLQVQAEYAEFAGWLHQDIGDLTAARFWLDRALESAHAAGDSEFAAFVLARKSQLAGDMTDPAGALDFAEAAARAADAHPRLAGAALTYAAHGHALEGMRAESMRVLDRARDYAAHGGESPGRLAHWLDASYIEVQRARCLSVLGRHAAAADIFERAIDDLAPEYHRDHGVYLARAARARAASGDPERAARAGEQALAIAIQTGSGRITTELVALDADLKRWKTVPLVTEFHDQFTDTLPRQVPAPPASRRNTRK